MSTKLHNAITDVPGIKVGHAHNEAAFAGCTVILMEIMKTLVGRAILDFSAREHTVIGVVATNAQLNKEQINKVAQMAQDGLARTVRPAHTMLDGDTIFALAAGEKKADVNIVGAFAAEVIAQAILRGVRAARPAGGLPSIESF